MPDPTSITSGIRRYKGPWDETRAAHLLRRTMFGVKRSDLAYFLGKSPRKAVRELLYTDYALPAPPVNNYNDDKYTDSEIAAGDDWTISMKYDGMNNGRRKNSFKSWWLGLMIGQDRSIREKMVLFWHNHFVTETNTVDNALFCYRYNVLLREHALGNFRQLVRAMTTEPAMLRYLNGYANTKKAPDENYGRELQELFTVGKGPGSHYTESDVRAAARVLTGYTVNYKTYTSSFDPNRHDEGDKIFSSFYGNTVIKGIKGKDAVAELDQMLDMIFAREEVSLFLCRKLYRFFVYHTIDDETEQQVIKPLAKLLRKKDYAIQPVLEELLCSRHFFDPANNGSMIKSPVDFTVGLCREFDVAFPDAGEYADLYGFWEQLRNQAAGLQQNIGDPPNVAGWQAYYQQPEYDKLWISSDTLPKRNVFSDRMIGGGLGRNGKKVAIDPVAFAAGLPDPANPDKLILDSVHALYSVELPPEELQFIKTNILLSGLVGMASDHYWTNAWLAYNGAGSSGSSKKIPLGPTQNLGGASSLAPPRSQPSLRSVVSALRANEPPVRLEPDDKTAKNTVTNKLKALYRHLMDLPEYQLM